MGVDERLVTRLEIVADNAGAVEVDDPFAVVGPDRIAKVFVEVVLIPR